MPAGSSGPATCWTPTRSQSASGTPPPPRSRPVGGPSRPVTRSTSPTAAGSTERTSRAGGGADLRGAPPPSTQDHRSQGKGGEVEHVDRAAAVPDPLL